MCIGWKVDCNEQKINKDKCFWITVYLIADLNVYAYVMILWSIFKIYDYVHWV